MQIRIFADHLNTNTADNVESNNSAFSSEPRTSQYRTVATHPSFQEVQTFRADDDSGNAALLFQAVFKEDVKKVAELLEHNVAHVNVTDHEENTALHVSAFINTELEMAKSLFHNARTAIEHAASNENPPSLFPPHIDDKFSAKVECVKILLQHGADVRAVNEEGNSPLHLYGARYCEDVVCVRELLSYGALVDASNKNGDTPLHLGVRDGRNVQYVKELLKHGAHVNVMNNKDETPLHNSLSSDTDGEIVKQLLLHGADPNLTHYLDRSPLQKAIRLRNADIIQQLLAHGAIFRRSHWIDIITAPTHIANLLIRHILIHIHVGDYRNLFDLEPFNFLYTYSTFRQRYIEKCFDEFDKMKSVKVNDYLSLYGLLTTKCLNISLYSEDKNTQIQEENLIANYPIFNDEILSRVNHALERGILLKKLNTVSVHSRNHCGTGRKVVLNYDCIYAIAQHLSNDAILNLMLTFPKRNTAKSLAPATDSENDKKIP